MLTFEELLSRFERVSRSGSAKARARCPAHEDRNPSLSLWHDPDTGRHNLKCHAGCDRDTVLGAVGLSWKDVTPPKPGQDSDPWVFYDYVDESGKLLYQVVRTSDKKFLQRRPAAPEDPESKVRVDQAGNRWMWKGGKTQRVLYRLPQIVDAVKAGRTVFIVEGEKDADNLSCLGLEATTNPGGAGKWLKRFAKSLSGADVIVIPDNDGPEKGFPGQDHACKVVRSLSGKVKRVRVLELPGEKNGRPVNDFSDWRAAGGTKDELLRLAESAPEGADWVESWKDRLNRAKVKAARKDNGRKKKGAKPAKPTDPPPPDPKQLEKMKQAAQAAAGELWTAPDVLDRFYRAAVAMGMVGEERSFKVLILAVTSRVTERPVNVFLQSESSSGKTYLARMVLDLLPPDVSYQLEGSSARAFLYDDDDYRHRTLLLNEVDAFATARSKDGDNAGVALLRSLVDSSEINYKTTVKGDDGRFTVQHVVKAGPTGAFFTGCHTIDHELTNRCIVLSMDESQTQTRAIKAAILRKAAGKSSARPNLKEFHGLQRRLQLTAPHCAEIPYAEWLAVKGKGEGLRARRDVETLVNLIGAHALLHAGSRDRNAKNQVLATLADYRAVYRIAAAVFQAEETGLTGKQREAVAAVCALRSQGDEVSVKAVAARLGLGRTAAQKRLGAGVRVGYLRRDDDQRPGSKALFSPGDELPTATSWLRPPDEVAALWENMQKGTDGAEVGTTLGTLANGRNPKESLAIEEDSTERGATTIGTQTGTHPYDANGLESLQFTPPNATGVPSSAPPGKPVSVNSCSCTTHSRAQYSPDPAFDQPCCDRDRLAQLMCEHGSAFRQYAEERAAVREHDGGQTRTEAELGALEDLAEHLHREHGLCGLDAGDLKGFERTLLRSHGEVTV